MALSGFDDNNRLNNPESPRAVISDNLVQHNPHG